MRFGFILHPLRTAKALLLCGTALIPASAVLGLESPALGQAVNLGNQNGNSIVPDGRTATRTRVQGSTTTITTSTLVGGNAYNSFSTFTEAKGNTVNLIVPRKADELVNIVRNGAVDIQGTLNAYKNGKIGGDVVFADSYGMIVGPAGVVNVGGLTVTTPTKDVIEGLIDKSGNVDQALAARVISGNVPLSADGSVLIHGQINAQNFVRITAQDIAVAGSLAEAQKAALHRAKFDATVNANGIVEGGAIVVRNGEITIVAANNAVIAGKLSTGGPTHVATSTDHTKAKSKVATASSITISAGQTATILGDISTAAGTGTPASISVTATEINVGATASLAALGQNAVDGGHISLKATDTTTVLAGASFAANALGTGNGGLIELSGETDLIDPNIHINLGSVTGTAGMLLFDPDKLVIGGVTQGTNTGETPDVGSSSLPSLYTDGASVELDAGTSITIDGVIDTRKYAGDMSSPVAGALSAVHPSTGNSGSITLSAPTITVNNGGALYADASGGGFTGGAVMLTASQTDTEPQAGSLATTAITVAGQITGAAVSITASSTASTSVESSVSGFAVLGGGLLGSAFTGLNGGYVGSTANATVTVSGTANITASGNLTISASGSETAEDPIISAGSLVFGSSQPVAAGVVVGIVKGNVSTEIQGSATLSSGGTLSVTAANNVKTQISAQTLTTSGAILDATVAYSHGSVTTSATIDSGANITKASNVVVAAQNSNSFSTTSTADALGTAQAGVAVAINDVSTSATAQLGASLGSGATVANVTVFSGSSTTENVVQSSVTVGSNFAEAGATPLVQSVTAPVTMFFGSSSAFSAVGAQEAMSAQGTSTLVPRGGVSLSLNLSSQGSTAEIAPTANGAAPTITATGAVAVASLLSDADIRADASTTINSNSYNPTDTDTATSSALALAVNVAQIGHNSNAFIGANVSITAATIGVDAQIVVPITNDWTNFASFSDVTSHFTGNLGIVNDILTSYTNATSNTAGTGLAGDVNYFNISNNTTAWVAGGASLTASAVGTNGIDSWSSSIALPSGGTTTLNWASGLVVTASTETESINVGGNFSWLTLFGTNSTTSDDSSSVGGSANVNIFTTDTIAGIAAGASVTADGGLSVLASTSDLVYGVAPTSGKGSGFGLNGVASVLMISNTTSASISDEAQVTASNVSIGSQQSLSSFSIGGAVGASKGTGVGIVVALEKIDTNTSAFVGDNSTMLATTGETADNTGALTPSTAGYVDAGALSVSALTVGRLTTVSVAAQYNNDGVQTSDPPAIQSTAPDDAGFLSKVFLYLPQTAALQAAQQFQTFFHKLLASNLNNVYGANSISGAGSTSVDLTSLGTSAYISSAAIDQSYTLGNSVSVQALNNTIIDSASGAAAIAKGAPGTSYSVGVAGAVALDLGNDSTTAEITSSSVNADNVTVQALAGGENTAIGLAISATRGTANTAVSVSISASVAVISDGVNALIDSSSITAPTTASTNTVSISADQSTEIGIGAGSLYLKLGQGNGGGVGIALTYAEIDNPSSGDAISAMLSNSSVNDMGSITVLALDESRIISGAATAGGGSGSDGFAGSVVVNAISPTVLAEITNAPEVSGTAAVTGNINVSGDVTVVSSGGSNSTLDGIISTAALTANGGLTGGGVPADDSGLDFTGAALSPSSSTGSAIIAVAGLVQYGASNVGVAIVVDTISQTHQALINGVNLTSTGGVVQVKANDDIEIIGVSFGVGIATGSVAGLGSIVYNSITNAVIAEIGDQTTTHTVADSVQGQVEAAAISVTAEDGSTIRGATGAVTINTTGGNSVGLSVTVDQISNYVNASVVGAKATADEALSDSSSLITGNLQGGDVIVAGQSNATITSVAVGVAISNGSAPQTPTPQENFATLLASLKPAAGNGEASGDAPPAPAAPASGLSGAGSLIVSTEATKVYSSANFGANSYGSDIAASNNVLISAENTDSIASYAGALSVAANAGKGIGASIIVDTISGTTSAFAFESTVDAHATGAAMTVDSGQLASTVDPSTAVTPASAPSLSDGTTSLSGIGIIATSTQKVQTVAAVYSASTDATALSANVITDVMGGTTEAYVTNSSLDTNLLASQTSAVQVSASSASFANNLDLGIADSGSSGAGTVVLVLNTMDRTTDASIQGTQIGSSTQAAGAVSIAASAWEGTSGEAIGVAASDGYGVAGSALVNLFSATTSSSLIGNTIDAVSLSTTANTTDGDFAAVGNAAFGSTAGLGAGVIVTTINNTTSALVGDPTATPTATTLNLTGALNVDATTTTKINSYDIALSAGGTAGVAAMVSFTEITNKTFSALDNTSVTIPTASGTAGAINVASQENATIDPVAGGLAAGGTGGVGASANVVILKSTNSALMNDDTISTPGAVSVTANSTRDIQAIDATGGLGGTAGIAATVGVVLVGSAASSDMLGLINEGGTGSLASADSATGSGGSVVAAIGAGVDGISAEIAKGSVTAGSVEIAASANTKILNVVGALGAGGTAGFGAAVGFTELDQTITANATGGSITTPLLMISATAGDDGSGPAAKTMGVAGAGGLYVGLGAAVAYNNVNDTVTASLSSTANGVATGMLGVNAADTSTLEGDAYGFAGGAAAVGLSIGEADKSSTVTASFAPSTTTTNFGAIGVTAETSGEVKTYTIAGAAGVFSGAGTSGQSTDSETVTASIGAGSSVTMDGAAGLNVAASATPDVQSSAIGVAVGAGAGIGVSVTKSYASETISAFVDSNSTNATTISGGPLTITAGAFKPTSDNTTTAYSVAAGGGLLFGGDGADATATTTTTVTAYGGTDLHLPSANVTIAAESDSQQNASTTGVAGSLYVAVGVTISNATSNANTSAYLEPGAVTTSTNTGVLTITASGTDTNNANAIAGSGGIVAGSAAIANTSTTDNTTATLQGGTATDTLYLGGLAINATHTTNFSAEGDAFQASIVGGSGGNTTNTVNSTVATEVGSNLIINSAGGDMVVVANDAVNETSGGARAGSGGVAAGAATITSSTVNQTVSSTIDADTVLSLNDDPSTSTAKIDIEAYNTLQTTDTVSLIAGGLFAGGGANSDLTATATNNVTINAGVTLFSAGDLDIGTAAEMQSSNNANANLYGLVTGAGASTNSSLTAHQTVTVDAALLEAWGLLNVYAGQTGSGIYSSFVSANATTTVYNEALIPITAKYSGSATAHDYTSLVLGAGSRILGVNNVFIGSTPGNVQAAGKGTNYNPYLSLFSTEKHDDNSNDPSTDVTGQLSLGGVIAAGIHYQEKIKIAYDGTLSLDPGSSPYDLTLELVNDVSDFNPVVSYNHQTIQYTVIQGFNPHTQIVNELATLSGLSTTTVTNDLNAGTQILAATDDAAGDNQRQINTLVVQAAFAANASGNSIAFGNMLASEGNVTILANSLTAPISNSVTPSIAASASAKLDIENQSPYFVDLSKLTISGVTGGHVDFTGAATSASIVTSSTQALTVSPDSTNNTPNITINSSYAGQINNLGQVQVVDSHGNVLGTTPDIYFDGDVVNLNGVINVNTQLGSVVIASENFEGATVQMTVPNGNLTYNGGGGSIYTTNSAVSSQWASVEYRPTDVTTAVDAAASSIGNFFYNYYYDTVTNSYVYNPVSQYGSSANTIFTARLLNTRYYQPGGGYTTTLSSDIFFATGNNDNGENAGWERGWYQGQAYSANDSGPFNCSGCNNFFTVVDYQTLNYTANTAVNRPTNSPRIIGGAIILSASVLNINGTIESGKSSSFSVDIGSAAQAQITAIKGSAITEAADSGKLIALTTTTAGAGDTKVNAYYDVSNDQIILQNVVQGTGGYVYLNGKIISTSTTGSPQGNIIVNGGYATVDVNNQTGTKLVTNTINTGVSSSNIIEIVDQNKDLTTWYVYSAAASANQALSTYTEAGVNNTSYSAATLQSQGANTTLQYDPIANQLYEWIDTATLSRPQSNNADLNGWTFSGVSANSPTYPYTQTTKLITQAQTSNFAETVSATGLSQTNAIDTSNPDKCCGTDFDGIWYQKIYYNLTLTLTNTVKASNPIGITFNAGTNSNVTVTSNASIVVNGPITNQNGATSISTTGADSAISTGVSQGSTPLVTGKSVTLTAPGGIGSLKNPLPVTIYNGTLTADSTDNDIGIVVNGDLSINHVTVSPATSGASPQGNVLITATGDINSATGYNVNSPVVSGKSVEIDTTGGAIGAISGVDGNGAPILTNINPLVIEAKSTTLNNGTVDGGLLYSTSSTGAYIIQSTGDLRLGTISSNGPVYLEAAAANGQTANIINGLTSGGLTAAQTTYLENVWTSLQLQSGGGALAVSSYESMITAAYQDYWQLRNLAFSSGQYSLTTLGQTVFASQIAAQTGGSVGSVTTAQIQAMVTTRYLRDQYLLGIVTAGQINQMGLTLDTIFGTTAGQTNSFQQAYQSSALQSALATYQSSYTYVLPTTSTLYTSLTSNAQWSLDQLTYTVDRSADPASNTPPASISSLPLNISARQVMLYAPTGSIGSLAPTQSFTFTSVNASSLTPADKGLLASAGPGQLAVTTTDLSNGVIQYSVNLTEQSLVIISPLGPVSANADGQIYLGSKTDLKLGGISRATYGPVTAAYSAGIQTISGGDVKLDAVGSILTGVAGQDAISGNISDLTLIAETGHIGSAGASGSDPATNNNALILALTGGDQVDQAIAAQGIYLRQSTGDLVLGNISAGSGTAGVIQLDASGSIYAEAQFTDRTAPHIVGSSLDIRTSGSVSYDGASYQPLQVEISGPVTGQIGGNLTILAPAGNLTIGVSGQSYGSLTSGATLVLDATTGTLTVNTSISGTTAVELLANGSETIAAGTSSAPLLVSSNGAVTVAAASLSMGTYSSIDAGGEITVTTTGNATIGQLSSTLANASGPAIDVAAGGSSTTGAILSAGDGRENIVASGANSDVMLSASGDIGSSTTALAVDQSTLSISSTGGNVFATSSSANALHVTSATATIGSFALAADGSLTVDVATTAKQLGLSSTNGSVTAATITAGGTTTVNAYGTITLASWTSTGGDIGATSQTGAITGGDVDAYGSANLSAHLNNTGDTLHARHGDATLTAGGLIDWNHTTAHGAVSMTSTTSTITVDDVTSGGSQTFVSPGDFNFTTLLTTGLTNDPGNISMTVSAGSITGQSVTANGGFSASASGIVSITNLTTIGPVSLASQISLNEGTLSVGSGTSFAAPTVTIANLSPSASSGTFAFSLTGYQGAIGSNANITVTTSAPVVLTTLAEQTATITETSLQFQILNGTIEQTLAWTTPTTAIWMNNQSITPIVGPDLQLFAQKKTFSALQIGALLATDAYVVDYGMGTGVVVNLPQGPILGASLVRDFDRTGSSQGSSTGSTGPTGTPAFTSVSPTLAFITAPSTNVLMSLDPSLDGTHLVIDSQGNLVLEDAAGAN